MMEYQFVVGNGCTPTLLTSLTAKTTVVLVTDLFPYETSLSYVNTCTKVETSILLASFYTLSFTEYKVPLLLQFGVFTFVIRDSIGDGMNILVIPCVCIVLSLPAHLIFLNSMLGFFPYAPPPKAAPSWSVVLGNVTLYQNKFFSQSEDKSVAISVGGGCKTLRPTKIPTKSNKPVTATPNKAHLL